MDDRLVEIVQSADWKRLTPRLENYADWILRRYLWRGLRVEVGKSGQLLVAGKSADDFVTEALDALLNGPRTYNFDLSLETNLQRTIKSSIWNWKKKSDAKPLLDWKKAETEEGEEFNPIMSAVDEESVRTPEAVRVERLRHQQILIAECEAALKSDEELSLLFDAYKNGFFKPAEIEELTGISASRVSELKRKLVGKMAHLKDNHPSVEPAGF